jgi:sigma-54 specific flagellar transcriptional regulator A
VRELQNLVERLSILCGGRRVEREDLPTAIGERRRAAQHLAETFIPSDGLDLREHLGTIEKHLIRTALDQTDGTVAHAARLLKLRRTTLVEKLRKYDLQARLSS